ncbi:coiled-coil domain-containing protein 34 [Drosophila rhopaloa]|uniref:Coiled-coil domain-containing protein 34 n=1 Tax=Drosophila rhopaloa TaxID=1041015 RepID=A0A6P4ETI7_DRORH|nr:coiled-coil domain-containing protein 34 [Drosophila rhopaloa]XP_016976448.1 coiled-coil domain-containing protein 34 [Drosophila rhopaloa]
MAFCGHVSASGEIVLRDEIFSSKTRLRRSSSPSDSPNSISSPDSLPQNSTSRTYSIKDDTANPSPHSAGNWSVLYDGLGRSGSRSNLVPSLCLSSQKSSFNYLRHVEGIKVNREPQAAYENWYSAKQRQRLERQQLLKQERDCKQQMVEERQQLARMCYDQWLKDKARRAASLQLESHLQAAAMKASLALGRSPLLTPSPSPSSSLGSGSSSSAASRPTRNASKDEIRQVVEEWWLKKQQQHQAQRQQKRRAMLSRALDEERRRQLAQVAWKKWMSNVDAKPKPVPLNQGMDSLRGTISQLYVNPTPWLGPIKPPRK